MSRSLFLNPVFKEAIADIEAMGLTVTAEPVAHAMSYAVVGGRSNSRWWLVPLENGRVTASGLALFQPLLASARYMKAIAVLLSLMGLSRFWVRSKVYIAGESTLQQYFATEEPLSFSYFTGTDSPHRKLAVQVMDACGNIRGYAKVSRNPAVKPLIQHEAATLNFLQTLDLETANIPNVLFCGAFGNACALVTDTLKTPKTKSVSKLQHIHLNFLRELAEKTKENVQNNPDWLLDRLRSRFAKLETRLTPEWKARLEKSITAIEKQKDHLGQPVMAHGDFTPWNTFVADGKLYVFDWEYSNNQYPNTYDFIHYILSLEKLGELSADQIIKNVIDALISKQFFTNRCLAEMSFLSYVCLHAMQYIEREIMQQKVIKSWDGDQCAKYIMDRLLETHYLLAYK